nr:hypothetical protein [Novosphingobium panipatense]
MHIRGTLAFSEANAGHERAWKAWLGHEKLVDDPRFGADHVELLRENLHSSADRVLRTSAITGKDVAEKLSVMLEYVDDEDRAFGWREIERDLEAMSRPEPGPDARRAFAAFRDAWVAQAEHDASEAHTDEEAFRLSDIVFDTLQSLFRVPCTTAGDFLVKSYAHLIWHAVHTSSPEARKAGNGSYYDIDLNGIDADSLVTDDYFRSVYDDLNHSDLGACLLATGSIDFDPRGWLERAERIGMTVNIIEKDGGAQALTLGMIDSDDERLQREERRLQRIMTFDHSRRWSAVSGFICEQRPDLVFRVASRADAA